MQPDNEFTPEQTAALGRAYAVLLELARTAKVQAQDDQETDADAETPPAGMAVFRLADDQDKGNNR